MNITVDKYNRLIRFTEIFFISYDAMFAHAFQRTRDSKIHSMFLYLRNSAIYFISRFFANSKIRVSGLELYVIVKILLARLSQTLQIIPCELSAAHLPPLFTSPLEIYLVNPKLKKKRKKNERKN